MKTKLLLFSLLPILAFSQTVGKINAEITAGVNIVQQNEMSFGRIISIGESTVTMTPQGARATFKYLVKRSVLIRSTFKVRQMLRSYLHCQPPLP
jgi:hypothetical protein